MKVHVKWLTHEQHKETNNNTTAKKRATANTSEIK